MAEVKMEVQPGNSFKSREAKVQEKKEIKPVKLTGSASVRKRSSAEKLAKRFIEEDGRTIARKIVDNIIIPEIKNIIFYTVQTILFNGDRKPPNAPANHTAYSVYYRGGDDRQRNIPKVSNGFDFDEVEFSYRQDAEVILSAMDDIIEQYGRVYVSDFYDLAQISNNNYMLGKYGWKNLQSAQVVPTRKGTYVIQFPRAIPID